MKNGMIIDWASAGALLANRGDEEQAEFINAMAKEMESWPTAHSREMQSLACNRLLTIEARQLCRNLGYEEGVS